MTSSLFALVDCNNFYVSCERVFNPKLAGKPVIVLSNNDGCVVSRSNEAKAIGIKAGVPVFKIREGVEKNNVVMLSSNYALYGDLSQRVMATLSQFSPELEVYSIDEAFLDFSGFGKKNLAEYALEIKRTVMQWIGIPISVGIASTKTLAKIAVKHAKKTGDGVYYIDPSENCDHLLHQTPVSDVWGMGRKYCAKLIENNVNTALQLKNADPEWVRKYFTVVGLRTVKELQGTPCVTTETLRAEKQMITSARTFAEGVTDFEALREAVSTFAVRASEKLRKKKSAATVVIVFVLTNRFKESNFYYNHKIIELPVPDNSATGLVTCATKALRMIFREGYSYKKAGVMLTGIVPDNELQLGLYGKPDIVKGKKAMQAIDTLNSMMGSGTIKIASEGTTKRWKMKSELRSPSYTTKWDDLLEVKTD